MRRYEQVGLVSEPRCNAEQTAIRPAPHQMVAGRSKEENDMIT